MTRRRSSNADATRLSRLATACGAPRGYQSWWTRTSCSIRCCQIRSGGTRCFEGRVGSWWPIRVVEELDAKKYSDSKLLQDRARSVLPWLECTLGAGLGPAPVDPHAQTRDATGTTIEVYPCGRPRFRPQDADEEVLDVAQEVLYLAGEVVVLTGDTSMRIRARGERFETLGMPDKWRR